MGVAQGARAGRRDDLVVGEDQHICDRREIGRKLPGEAKTALPSTSLAQPSSNQENELFEAKSTPMLSRTSIAAAAVLLGAALVSIGAARPAASTSSAVFVVTGRGWGHGVGMAQYGVLGYARHGSGYQKILAHYYPGTTLTKTAVKQVRVLLADGASSVTLASQADFRVRDVNGKSFKLDAGSYSIGPGLKVRVQASAAPKALEGPLMFTPGRVPLQLGRRYRGSIQVTSSGGRLQAINIVGLEDYVRGVVSQEVSPDWPAQALAVQAIASRSYAVATRKKSGSFDVFADTRSQVYGGVDAEEFSTSAAVDATAGKILSYRGQPAVTYFYASSGGKTAAVEDAFSGARPIPYLVSVSDPYDTLSPYHTWGPYVYSAGGLAKRLGVPGKVLDARVVRNDSSRVNSVTLTTTRGQRTISGRELGRTLDLRSTWFSVGVLSLTKPAKPLVYGVESELTGIARAVKKVRIERLSGGAWELVARVHAAAGGAFAESFVPKAGGSYRLASRAASTAPVKVTVAAFIRLDAGSNPLSGRARPIFPSAVVSVQRLEGQTWTQVTTATLDQNGRFSTKLQLTPGTYRARIAPGHGLVAGVSPVLRVVGQ